LSETNTTYVVVKNRLLELALKESGRVAPEALLKNANGVAFIGEDVAKSVYGAECLDQGRQGARSHRRDLGEFRRRRQGAEALSDLPTKEQTRAMLLGRSARRRARWRR
jgi:large subunit ribosomal protein L10